MEFKIDTKDTFTTIMPLEKEINAKLTGELQVQVEKMRQSGSNNFIVNLQQCTEIDLSALLGLIGLHEESYGLAQSLVFTGMNDIIIAFLKKEETDLLINLAPTMKEAIDIVSMEILERELLGEE